ncbi:hypothetical protein AXFE_34430 [Acidithrix ferrooxidans]|uniref:Uncharacterized protein n=1 Tax=Acidithrix ferrooxidans TaxID=1280514 RepID=A0A0D8HCQ7_9ACTN|nr:hypothetical protein [Acidithrix ferrooxidans]KJF15713.1 hypothetical protein AXFE_34430 [Acidithrix ferrooxidans]
MNVVVGAIESRMPHIARQIWQHSGDVLSLSHPFFDVGVGEMMPEVIWSRLLATCRSLQCGLIPDAVEYCSDRCSCHLDAITRDKECLAGRAKVLFRYPFARGENLNDFAGQGEPPTAVALRPQDVDVAVMEVDMLTQKSAGLHRF